MIAIQDTIPATAVNVSTAVVSDPIEVVSINLVLRKTPYIKYTNFAGNCNSKIYDYINSSTIPSTVFLNTASATSDSEKADLLNTFFHLVYKPSPSNSSLPPSPESYPNITNISFTELDVLSALSSLQWRSHAGARWGTCPSN